MMAYDRYWAENLPIGSGTIEAPANIWWRRVANNPGCVERRTDWETSWRCGVVDSMIAWANYARNRKSRSSGLRLLELTNFDFVHPE